MASASAGLEAAQLGDSEVVPGRPACGVHRQRVAKQGAGITPMSDLHHSEASKQQEH